MSEKKQIYTMLEDIFDDLTTDYDLNHGSAELSTFHEDNDTQWFTLEGPFNNFAEGEIAYTDLLSKTEDEQYTAIFIAIADALEQFKIPDANDSQTILHAKQDQIFFIRKGKEIRKEIVLA